MNTLRKIKETLLFPKTKIAAIPGAIFIAFSAVCLIPGLRDSLIAYISYLLAAYGLYLEIITLLIPFLKKIRQRMFQNPFLNRYYTESQFHARVILYRGAAINIGYAVFKLVVGIWSQSAWLLAIAVYYIILSGIKLVLIQADAKTQKQQYILQMLYVQWRAYRIVAGLIMLLSLSLIGILILVLREGKSFSYPGVIIFAMAFYAFYRIVVAVIRLYKEKGQKNPLFSAAKIIDFLFAVIAMFTLQTAMLSAFDESGSSFRFLANVIGGSAAFAIVLGMASYMIIHAQRQIESLKG